VWRATFQFPVANFQSGLFSAIPRGERPASRACPLGGTVENDYTYASHSMLGRLLSSAQAGLLLVIICLGALLTLLAGSHGDRVTGETVNNFLNSYTLIQTLTDASFFAVMAVGATIVIISGGIDLSVGSIYALAGVMTAMALRAYALDGATAIVMAGLVISVGVGLLCGIVNGLMVVGLGVHPFIITLGTMWVLRGIAFVSSNAESIGLPRALTAIAKAPLGLGESLYPVPTVVMIAVTAAGSIYLQRTVMGRHVFAIGGNAEASRFSGLRLGRIQIGVFVISGLTAGIAAFMGASFYGSASCVDATGYELYVIASAVVGGASLSGGKGSAVNAMLGAVLIVLIRQSIRTLHFDQNYEWIIIGCAIIVAVTLDQANARLAARRLARAASARPATLDKGETTR
jgi:ribose/xylose/arabinose/galactoside ABC-type transport system permease subunit